MLRCIRWNWCAVTVPNTRTSMRCQTLTMEARQLLKRLVGYVVKILQRHRFVLFWACRIKTDLLKWVPTYSFLVNSVNFRRTFSAHILAFWRCAWQICVGFSGTGLAGGCVWRTACIYTGAASIRGNSQCEDIYLILCITVWPFPRQQCKRANHL